MEKIRSMTYLLTGQFARIVSVAVADKITLRKLSAFGIIPGQQVEIVQTFPAWVVKIGYTQVALDENIVKLVYVQKINE